MARTARIVSTGRFLPPSARSQRRAAPPFRRTCPSSWTRWRPASGIRSRWYAPEDWATSDVALPAARQALERAGRRPEDVDLIVLGTDSPDYVTPATSVVLQHKLGATNAGTFDVGLRLRVVPDRPRHRRRPDGHQPQPERTVLVVGVYLMHKLADPRRPDGLLLRRRRRRGGAGAGRPAGLRRVGLPGRRRPTTATGGSTPAARTSRPARRSCRPGARP